MAIIRQSLALLCCTLVVTVAPSHGQPPGTLTLGHGRADKQEQTKTPDPMMAAAQAARNLKIIEFLRIGPVSNRQGAGGLVSTAPVVFIRKEGYLLRDLRRFLSLIEDFAPGVQVESVDLGLRDDGSDYWRPRKMKVRAVSKQEDHNASGPRSALPHLDAFLAVVHSPAWTEARFKVTKLRASDGGIAWDMKFPSEGIDVLCKLTDMLLDIHSGQVERKLGTLSQDGNSAVMKSCRLSFSLPQPVAVAEAAALWTNSELTSILAGPDDRPGIRDLKVDAASISFIVATTDEAALLRSLERAKAELTARGYFISRLQRTAEGVICHARIDL